MSAGMARARPATVARLVRRAISETASKSPIGGDREAGLDDVDAHRVEQLGDRQLLVEGHGGAGTLLAVAQGGVEDHDPVAGGGAGGRCHGVTLSRAARLDVARRGVVPWRAVSRVSKIP